MVCFLAFMHIKKIKLVLTLIHNPNMVPKNLAECDPTPISPVLCCTIQVCTVSKQPLPTNLKPVLLGVAPTPGRFTHVAYMKSLCGQALLLLRRTAFNGPVWLIIT